MPSLSSSLPQLRETLASLESYELPDRYKPLSSSSSPSNKNAIIDPELFQRYLKAKDSYLRKRMNHMFIEHLATLQCNKAGSSNKENDPLDNSNSTSGGSSYSYNAGEMKENSHNGTFKVSFPAKPTMEEIEDLNAYKQSVSSDLLSNIQSIRSSYDNVYNKYKSLNDRKDEIRNLIQTIEQQQQGNADVSMESIDHEEDDNHNDLNDTTIEESELMLQEEQLRNLRERKAMLHMKLHKLQMEKELVKSSIEKDKILFQDLIAARNGDVSNHGDATNNDGNTRSTNMDQGQNKNSTTSTSTIDLKNVPSIEELEKENQRLQEQSQNYQEMGEYYDSIKCAMEVIGGMKILSITPVTPLPNSEEEVISSPYSSPSTSPTKFKRSTDNNSNSNSSNSKRNGTGSSTRSTKSTTSMALHKLSPPKESSPSHKNRQHRRQLSPQKDGSKQLSNMKSQDSINLKVLLLDCHVVNLTLTTHISSSSSLSSPIVSPKKLHSQQQAQQQQQQQVVEQPLLNYRVKSAKFETPTVITDTIHDENDGATSTNTAPNNDNTISMVIPPLDDLVSLSSNLKPLEDIRFILREAMARIRIISQRVDVLGQLKLKYLTRVTNPMKNKVKFGYGGEYQEVVCSLPCQITVVLRLTCDCPLLNGSVFIHQIVGVSGWDNDGLERMKKKVNMKKWRSPIQVMDALDEEIRRVVKDEGVVLPKTPYLPMRRKHTRK